MSWNFRVIEYEKDGHKLYGISEVYYDENEVVKNYNDPRKYNPVNDIESVADLKGTMALIIKSFGKPVLIEKDLISALFKMNKTILTEKDQVSKNKIKS